ncbi:hypothetical protein MY11210_002119 [Beauveria gryllotalpidicola]
MLIKSALFQSLGFALLSHALPSTSCQAPGLSLTPIHTVAGTQGLENLAVRHNGQILVTSISSPTLHQVSPSTSESPVAIAEFCGVTSLFGIVELQADVFYVIGSNLTELVAVPGSTGLWKVDLRNSSIAEDATTLRPAEVSLVARFPAASLFNGMDRLSQNDTSHVLISDSGAGTVTKVNVDTGAFETVIQDPQMSITTEELFPIGINGIHVHDNDLFFVNFNQAIFAKVPISPSTGRATGPVEVLATINSGDDFILSRDGTKAWIAEHGPNILVEVNIPRKTSRIVANSTLLMDASAVALGRTSSDHNSLYIAAASNVNGTDIGQLVRAGFPYSL